MDERCAYSALPVGSWFILPRDPNHGPLFKCDERSALDRQYKHLLVSADEEVIVAVLPSSAEANQS